MRQNGLAIVLGGFMARHRHELAPHTPRRRASTPEGRLLRRIVAALRREPDLLVWRNPVGVGTHDGRRVTYGLAPGSADRVGILGPQGRFVALEVKAPAGRVTAHQARWLERVRRCGGFGCVVRSVGEARDAIIRARTGDSA